MAVKESKLRDVGTKGLVGRETVLGERTGVFEGEEEEALVTFVFTATNCIFTTGFFIGFC